MTFSEYRKLNETEQLIALCTDGVDMNMMRSTANGVTRLYAMADFYVELYFHKCSSLPHGLNVINDTEALAPYIELIDVEYLLEEKQK